MEKTTLITLQIGDLGADKFRVLSFEGKEAMSQVSSFRILAVSDDGEIPDGEILGRKAALSFMSDGHGLTHHGLIVESEQEPLMGDEANPDGFHLYTFTLKPRLELLAYNRQSRIFHHKNLQEIASQVLEEGGIPQKDFRFDFEKPSKEREFTVQYNESDLDFLQRLLESEGAFYFFETAEGRDRVVLADRNTAFADVPFNAETPFRHESGLHQAETEFVRRLYRRGKLVTGKVMVKDYNSETPEASILARQAGEGPGMDYSFGSLARNAEEALRIARLRGEMHGVERVALQGQGYCRDFRPGFRFRLKDDARTGFRGDFLLVAVEHRATQKEGFEGGEHEKLYENIFRCIPAEIPFRTRGLGRREKISGIVSARVDGQEGPYASLDDLGRYRSRFPFDLSDRQQGEASCPIRLAQPYSGPDYGMHFPVHQGSEMLVAFIDGDADRPIGIGTLPNPSNPSPVNARNRNENLLKTASGHSLKLDDLEGKRAIELLSAGGHKLKLDDDPEKKGIGFKTTDGHEAVFDDKNRNVRIVTAENGHTVLLDNENKVLSLETRYGHKLRMDENSKSFTLETKDKHTLKLDDAGKLITLSDGEGKHLIQIDAAKNTISIKTDGDLEMEAKGDFNLKAKSIALEAKQDFSVKALKDFAVDAMKVGLKAKQTLGIEANQEVGIAAKMALKLEGGMSFEANGGMKSLVSGGMVNVEAKGINTIKGGMVLIN